MRILVTGATGLVGQALCARFARNGHELVVLSRNGERAKQTLPMAAAAFDWDLMKEPAPAEAVNGCDAVIHLAGESVQGRWNDEKKRRIKESRTVGTANLVAGIEAAEKRPGVLISASAMGYYGDRGDEELFETSPPADDFLARVCKQWEAASEPAEELGLRVVRLRISLVLSEDGGAIEGMMTPTKLGISGPIGGGRQWWSWIHIEDLLRVLELALENEEISGAVNVGSPNPVRQKEFAKALGKAVGRPAVMPAPAFAVKAALGGFAMELLASRRLLPQALQRAGFEFRYAVLDRALADLLG